MSGHFDIVIAVSGLIASGKGEIHKRLAGRGYGNLTLSAAIRDAALKEVGPEYQRSDLVRIGNREREAHGPGYWATATVELARQAGHRKLVIDGIRNPGELEALRHSVGPQLVPVAVTAPTISRFQWAMLRKQSGDPSTLEEFLARDDADRGFGQSPHGQQVDLCIAIIRLADPESVYNNAGTLQEYHQWIDMFCDKAEARAQG